MARGTSAAPVAEQKTRVKATAHRRHAGPYGASSQVTASS